MSTPKKPTVGFDPQPAFPPLYGMTLRDWFAGQAISFIVQQPMAANNITYASAARDAYKYANHMLAARKKDL